MMKQNNYDTKDKIYNDILNEIKSKSNAWLEGNETQSLIESINDFMYKKMAYRICQKIYIIKKSCLARSTNDFA